MLGPEGTIYCSNEHSFQSEGVLLLIAQTQDCPVHKSTITLLSLPLGYTEGPLLFWAPQAMKRVKSAPVLQFHKFINERKTKE